MLHTESHFTRFQILTSKFFKNFKIPEELTLFSMVLSDKVDTQEHADIHKLFLAWHTKIEVWTCVCLQSFRSYFGGFVPPNYLFFSLSLFWPYTNTGRCMAFRHSLNVPFTTCFQTYGCYYLGPNIFSKYHFWHF